MRKKPYRKADALIEFVSDRCLHNFRGLFLGFTDVLGDLRDDVLEKSKRVKHEL